jgi:hypothetical protein
VRAWSASLVPVAGICDRSGMQEAEIIACVRRMYRLLELELDQRRDRQWAAAEARVLCGHQLDRMHCWDRIGPR